MIKSFFLIQLILFLPFSLLAELRITKQQLEKTEKEGNFILKNSFNNLKGPIYILPNQDCELFLNDQNSRMKIEKNSSQIRKNLEKLSLNFFKLENLKKKQEIIIKLKQAENNFEALILSEKEFLGLLNKYKLIDALLIGCFLALLVYNIISLITEAEREISFVIYILFAALISTEEAFNHLGHLYWAMSHKSLILLITVLITSVLHFRMTNLKYYRKKQRKRYLEIQFLILLALLFTFLSDIPLFIKQILASSFALFSIVISFKENLQDKKQTAKLRNLEIFADIAFGIAILLITADAGKTLWDKAIHPAGQLMLILNCFLLSVIKIDLIKSSTERKTDEALKLVMAKSRLGQISKIVRSLTFQIKKPLDDIIVNCLSTLDSDKLNQQSTEDLEIISRQSLRIKKIINQLDAFSDVKQSRLKALPMTTLVNHLGVFLKDWEKSYSIKLSFEFPVTLPSIMGNIDYFEHIFLNLLNNARDSIKEANQPDGEITIKFKTKNEAASEKQIIIDVSDNGPKISTDTAKNMFDPFFTTKEVGMGTGLGLSIVFGLVKRMNGEINFLEESKTFRMQFKTQG